LLAACLNFLMSTRARVKRNIMFAPAVYRVKEKNALSSLCILNILG
jgi:hypothetical protein